MDTVFFQQFELDSPDWGIATAENGKIFRKVNTTHSAYIGEVNAGTGLWKKIGETETVPSDTPMVRNKFTIAVADFANAIHLSKNLFDDNINALKRLASQFIALPSLR